MLPVLAEMALQMGVHPLYLMFPAALSCSMAFHTPVGTCQLTVLIVDYDVLHINYNCVTFKLQAHLQMRSLQAWQTLERKISYVFDITFFIEIDLC